MTPTKIVVDCATGEETVVPLTAEEQAEHSARASEPVPEPAPDPLATLLADLAKATTVAQIRAAATKAADL